MATRLQFKKSLAFKMKLKATYLRSIAARKNPGIEMRPFIVTGPPRSGTSLMTALLARKTNVLVANEPVVVGDPLLAMGKPERLLKGYMVGMARKAVQEGRFTTKVDPDQSDRATTDTANRGALRSDVTIELDRNQPLCTGIKHPVSFMEFLEELVTGWNDLKVIAIVRQPGPTIRSWRETTYGWQPGLDGPNEGLQRRMYREIPQTDNALARRAHLWTLMVERAETWAAKRPDQVLMFRYEELLEHPGPIMRRLYEHIRAPQPDVAIDVSDVSPQNRPAYKGFTDEEAEIIESICGEADRRTRETCRLIPAG
ncbi:MAG: sulfotransferase [Planctomycetota bacterium]